MKASLKSQFMKLKNKKPQTAIGSQKEQKEQTNKLNKTKSEPQRKKQSKNCFKTLSFCFPHLDIDLTKKQVQIMTKLIQSQKGKVIEFSQYFHMQPVTYVLINPKARIQNILKNIQGKLNYLDILDYNYIQIALVSDETIDPTQFSLLNKQQDYPQKKQHVQSGKKKRKMSSQSQKQIQKKLDYDDMKQLSEDEDPQQRNFKKQKILDKNKFFCQKGKQQNQPDMNKFIEQQLLELQKIYANQKDIGRKIAYGKAASIIRTWKQPIVTQADVDKIIGIGPKIRDKIKQIVSTGKLKKLQQFNQSQQVVAMGQLSKIWGVGPAKAKQLYKQGIKSIQQLRKNQQSLTRNQKIGLKYYQDFEKRIPRQKVTKMFNFVQKTLSQIVTHPDIYKAQVCGSYRRGKQTCGDMDIIITRKDGVFQKELLVKLVAQLHKKCFLTDNLSEPKCSQGHVSISYMGVCRFQDQTHHRIDIKQYPLQEYAFALLYFTGSGMFNRSMRLYASKKGLLLSDKGFSRRPQKNGVYWDKPIPVCYNEEDVFKVLELDYRTPKQRDD